MTRDRSHKVLYVPTFSGVMYLLRSSANRIRIMLVTHLYARKYAFPKARPVRYLIGCQPPRDFGVLLGAMSTTQSPSSMQSAWNRAPLVEFRLSSCWK